MDRASLKKLWEKLKKKALWIEPTAEVKMIPEDPDDNKFLECAQEAKADFLVTGNIHHFSFKKAGKTRIVTPAEFMKIIATLLIEEE
jgi:predicted nucleic acid-binding protein